MFLHYSARHARSSGELVGPHVTSGHDQCFSELAHDAVTTWGKVTTAGEQKGTTAAPLRGAIKIIIELRQPEGGNSHRTVSQTNHHIEIEVCQPLITKNIGMVLINECQQ